RVDAVTDGDSTAQTAQPIARAFACTSRTTLMLLAVCALGTSPRAAAQSPRSQASAPAQEHQHGPAEPASVLFPAREAAGTSWQPETGVMYGAHLRRGSWEVMLHGNVFAQVLVEPGERHRT